MAAPKKKKRKGTAERSKKRIIKLGKNINRDARTAAPLTGKWGQALETKLMGGISDKKLRGTRSEDNYKRAKNEVLAKKLLKTSDDPSVRLLRTLIDTKEKLKSEGKYKNKPGKNKAKPKPKGKRRAKKASK